MELPHTNLCTASTKIGNVLNHDKSQEARRMARKRGRAASSKRGRSKRKETRARLVEQIGVEEFKKIVQKDRREREGR